MKWLAVILSAPQLLHRPCCHTSYFASLITLSTAVLNHRSPQVVNVLVPNLGAGRGSPPALMAEVVGYRTLYFSIVTGTTAVRKLEPVGIDLQWPSVSMSRRCTAPRLDLDSAQRLARIVLVFRSLGAWVDWRAVSRFECAVQTRSDLLDLS